MYIMLGCRDRDFLKAFSKLFELEGNTVETAFDGTQIITGLAEKKPELAVLDAELPRIRCGELIKILNDADVPVIIITGRKPRVADLMNKDLAMAYISLPFLPDELKALVEDVMEKRQNGSIIKFDDAEVDEQKFLMCGKVRLTAEEINIIRRLSQKQTIENGKSAAYIGALNNKLEMLGRKTRIKYMLNEGYRLVMNDG